jgi:hypothetical protein
MTDEFDVDVDAFIVEMRRLGWWREIREHDDRKVYNRGVRGLATTVDNAWALGEIATLEGRLEKGSDFRGATRDVQKRGDDLFIDLLRRYEVLLDVTRHQAFRVRHRIEPAPLELVPEPIVVEPLRQAALGVGPSARP